MNRIVRPILCNLPLFLISIVLLGAFDVAYHQHLFHENDAAGLFAAYGEMILFAYFICLVSTLLRRIHLKVLFYTILLAVYIVNFYLRFAFSTDISPKILLLLFETNAKEVSGFFRTYFMTSAMYKTIGALVVLTALILIGEHFRERINQIVSRRPLFSWCAAIMLLVGIVGGSSAFVRYWGLIRCHNTFETERWIMKIPFRKGMPMPNLCYSLETIRMSGQDLYRMIDATKASLANVTLTESDSLNIVLVIGESYNKYHASLYGYYLDTTPYQCEAQDAGNLIALNRVKAPHNMTSIVLKNVFCCNDIHEDEKWFDSPFFPAMFKKAGYDVWMWDNQYQWDQNAAWAFTLNSILFNDSISKMSYTAINPEGFPYDDGLISSFGDNELKRTGKHNLIIFHLGGQHFLAKNQYPDDAEHNVFSAKDVKDSATSLTQESRQRIAEYANATRYNDEVIHHIMQLFQDTNTLLVYFPDHGEEVYDYRDFYGRQILGEDKITDQLIKYQMEIPFIIWCSDKWKTSHEALWNDLANAIDKDFTTDKLCHMLFRLGGIKTDIYRPSLDLSSPEYTAPTKTYNMLAL